MSPDFTIRAWDDYSIPGTNVLRNKSTSPTQPYGITDALTLEQLEHVTTAARLIELRDNPIPGPLNYDHMKAIHRHIFQDVYEWAGQERVAPTDGPTWPSKGIVRQLLPKLHCALTFLVM